MRALEQSYLDPHAFWEIDEQEHESVKRCIWGLTEISAFVEVLAKLWLEIKLAAFQHFHGLAGGVFVKVGYLSVI